MEKLVSHSLFMFGGPDGHALYEESGRSLRGHFARPTLRCSDALAQPYGTGLKKLLSTQSWVSLFWAGRVTAEKSLLGFS